MMCHVLFGLVVPVLLLLALALQIGHWWFQRRRLETMARSMPFHVDAALVRDIRPDDVLLVGLPNDWPTDHRRAYANHIAKQFASLTASGTKIVFLPDVRPFEVLRASVEKIDDRQECGDGAQ